MKSALEVPKAFTGMLFTLSVAEASAIEPAAAVTYGGFAKKMERKAEHQTREKKTGLRLFGTTDSELLEQEGKAFTAGGNHYTVDVHGHSLSVYNGTGSRHQTAHDVIVRKIADIMA